MVVGCHIGQLRIELIHLPWEKVLGSSKAAVLKAGRAVGWWGGGSLDERAEEKQAGRVSTFSEMEV